MGTRKLFMLLAIIAMAAALAPTRLVMASYCRVEMFDYICMGAGQTVFSPPLPPAEPGDWTCFKNDDGIGQRCLNAVNEPDGARCIPNVITCWWEYWLSCGPGPDSPKSWDSRTVDSTEATGIPDQNC